jgi:membrane protease YdiL (CAAX protease family)
VNRRDPVVIAPAASLSTRRSALWFELVTVFAGLPIVIGMFVPPALWLPSLWVVAAISAWRSWRDDGPRLDSLWAPIDPQTARAELRRIGMRFMASAALLVTVMAIVAPARLFDSTRPPLTQWFAFLVLYPLLSVLAQEQLYRRYLFQRFRDLNLSAVQTVWASALAFAAMHAIYRNVAAVVLTLVGGWFFADTYRRTESLRLVCLEHALYGNLLFATGLWPFFSHEAVIM